MIGRTGVVGVGLPPSTYHVLTYTRVQPTPTTFERVVRVPRVAATSTKRSPVDTVEDKIRGGLALTSSGSYWLTRSVVRYATAEPTILIYLLFFFSSLLFSFLSVSASRSRLTGLKNVF